MSTHSMNDEIETIYPVTAAQHGMIFHSVYEPSSAVYLDQFRFRIAGADADALRGAWQRAMDRHAVLRTALFWEGLDRPQQVVYRRAPLPWSSSDLSARSPEERDRIVVEEAAATLKRGFPLAEAPLFRLDLYRLDASTFDLVWTFHHALLDGWSVALLLDEVPRIYSALRAGEEPRLPPAPAFGDYIAWLERRDLARAEAYWRRVLAGFCAPITLPRCSSEPLASEDVDAPYDARLFEIEGPLIDRLQALARRARVTLNTVAQAAFAWMLSCATGQADLVYGAVTSGRPPELPGVERMVGMLINTLAVRVQVDPGQELDAFMRDLQRAQIEMREHEHTPLAKVQEWSDVPRGEQLFQALFVFENYPAGEPHPAASEWRMIDGSESTHLPLSVCVKPAEGKILLLFSFDRRRLDAYTIDVLSRMYRRALEAFSSQESRPLGRYALIDPEERRRALVEWNDTARPLDPRTAPQRIAEQAARTPEAIAVVAQGVRLSYGELDRRARAVASRLRALGVRAESRVAVCMERRADLVVALLGIWRAGAAYVPLDMAYPRDRLAFILEDSGAELVVTTPSAMGSLPPEGARKVPIDELLQGEPGAPATWPAPRNLAYVIYTSGSTGRPKGVAVEHANLAAFIDWSRRLFGPEAFRCALAGTSICFDLSIFELFPALCFGGTVLLEESALALLRGALAEEPTLVGVVPSAIAEIAREGRFPASVRFVSSGGEALGRKLADDVYRGAPTLEVLYNAYGPTEATVYATIEPVPRDEQGPPSIGRPIDNMRVYVLDARLEPVPIGVTGELYIGGVGVARGYINRPELTAQRFLPDPFGRAPGERMYRTGDHARLGADGRVDFLGRIDDEVKIRGYRITLGEIEATLRAHPSIEEAVVQASEGPSGGKRLVAYLVPAPGAALLADEVRRFVGTKLPDWMVPAAVVTLERLPLLPNGKLDRRALPAPGPERPELGSAYAAAESATERALVELWKDLLGVEQVGVDDNFFDLGGDSILSLQLVGRAQELGIGLTPRLVFQNRTIALLAAAVDRAAVRPRVEEAPVTGPVPLSPIQRWFFEQERRDPHHFNQAVLLDLGAGTDAALVERALNRVAAHHDAFRLRFRREASGWIQECAPAGEAIPLERIDLRGAALPDEALVEAADRLQASLRLAEGPLTRAALVERGDRRQLLWIIHHLCVDAVSWRILLEDLEAAYDIEERGAGALPARTDSIKRWAERLVRWAEEPELAEEREAWLRAAAVPVAPLPRDVEGGENLTASVRRVERSLDEAATRALVTEAAPRFHAQLNELLLSALVEALAAWTGEGRLRVDLESHGRTSPGGEEIDLSRTVGWFTSLYPVTFERGAAATPAETLRVVKEAARAVPQDGIGHGVARYLAPDREAASRLARARSEISYNFLGHFDATLARAKRFALSPRSDEHCGAVHAKGSRRTHLIEVIAGVERGRLSVTWLYSGDIYRSITIETLADRMMEALAGFAAREAPTLAALDPSDFPLAELSADGLSALSKQLEGLE